MCICFRYIGNLRYNGHTEEPTSRQKILLVGKECRQRVDGKLYRWTEKRLYSTGSHRSGKIFRRYLKKKIVIINLWTVIDFFWTAGRPIPPDNAFQCTSFLGIMDCLLLLSCECSKLQRKALVYYGGVIRHKEQGKLWQHGQYYKLPAGDFRA